MNAIILAAGTGLRLSYHTKYNNKVLLPVGRIPFIETTIKYLKQVGIEDITIVVGHKSELFNYLIDKYQVELIYNSNYSIYNNLYSLGKVVDQIEDTYIINGDISMFKNIFNKKEKESFVYTTLKSHSGAKHYIPIMDHNDKLVSVKNNDEHLPALLGVTYINSKDAMYFKEKLKETMSEVPYKKDRKVEDLIISCINKIKFNVNRLDSKYVTDINTLDDYFSACIKFDTYFD